MRKEKKIIIKWCDVCGRDEDTSPNITINDCDYCGGDICSDCKVNLIWEEEGGMGENYLWNFMVCPAHLGYVLTKCKETKLNWIKNHR